MPPPLGTTRHLHSSHFTPPTRPLDPPGTWWWSGAGLDVPLLPHPREKSPGKNQDPSRQGDRLPGAGGQGRLCGRDSPGEEVVGTGQPQVWQIVAIGSGHPTPGAGPWGTRPGHPMATALSLPSPGVWHTQPRAPTQHPKHTLPLDGALTSHPHNVSLVPTTAGTRAVPLHHWGGQKGLQTRGAPQYKPRDNTEAKQGWGPQSVPPGTGLGRVHLRFIPSN